MTNETLERELANYHALQEEIKNLAEQSDACKTKISELLLTEDITEYESTEGVSVSRFTPKPSNRLNKGLVESFCQEKNLDLQMFYKETATREQVKILIPSVKKKMEKYLAPKDDKEIEQK